MRERVMLGAALLAAGVVCLGVTVIAAAWLDAVSLHERTAEIQSAVQVELQGKAMKPVEPHSHVLSPLMLWTSFGIGGYLLVAGFVIGLRSLSYSGPRLAPAGQ
ncbi:MAG TPA: hypothetical protein VG099_20860 [Gemmataceae bacterium]|nr:hypothetical protein [Gemmataceae bacterium]